MNVLEAIRGRRSIRKYQDRQIPREDLEKILEAGSFAPNAGGGQRAILVGVHNRELTSRLGRQNLAKFDRSRLAGNFVSKEQPSTIDDPTIRNGFYGAPTVCVVFGPENFLYSVPDAFCCAENMVLAAYELRISSCVIARAGADLRKPPGRPSHGGVGHPQPLQGPVLCGFGLCRRGLPAGKAPERRQGETCGRGEVTLWMLKPV